MRETLAGFRRETLEVVVHECPDAPSVVQMPLDLERPALERRFAFPKKFAVTMDSSAVMIVFRSVIAEEAQIQEIRRMRQELERRKIPFIQRAGVRPNPTDAVFFKKVDKLRAMPAGVAEFDRKAEVAREFF